MQQVPVCPLQKSFVIETWIEVQPRVDFYVCRVSLCLRPPLTVQRPAHQADWQLSWILRRGLRACFLSFWLKSFQLKILGQLFTWEVIYLFWPAATTFNQSSRFYTQRSLEVHCLISTVVEFFLETFIQATAWSSYWWYWSGEGVQRVFLLFRQFPIYWTLPSVPAWLTFFFFDSHIKSKISAWTAAFFIQFGLLTWF